MEHREEHFGAASGSQHSTKDVGDTPAQATASLAVPPPQAELARRLSLPEEAGTQYLSLDLSLWGLVVLVDLSRCICDGIDISAACFEHEKRIAMRDKVYVHSLFASF